MLFKPYLSALRRRWRVILLTNLLVLAALLITYSPPRSLHRIELRYIVGAEPLPSTARVEEERYYRWVGSEYEVYSIADWANGTAFATRVLERLEAAGVEMDLLELDQQMYAEAVRSRLLIGVLAEDEATVRLMGQIVNDLLLNLEGVAIPQFGQTRARLFPIDVGEPDLFNPPVTQQLNLPVRLVLGLASGFALAALLELFDPTIRSRAALADLRLPLLGEIPGEG